MKHSRALFQSRYGAEDEVAHSMLSILYGFVGLWFVAAFIGGAANLFTQTGGPPVPIGIFLVIPIGGFTLAYAMSSRVRHAVDQIPLWLITIAHVWRFV